MRNVYLFIITFLFSNFVFAISTVTTSYVDDKYAAMQAEIKTLTTVKLGTKYSFGTIFYLDNKSRRGLIASLNDLSGTYQQCTSEVSFDASVKLFKGLSNSLTIVNDPCLSPAVVAINAHYCPEDWYHKYTSSFSLIMGSLIKLL